MLEASLVESSVVLDVSETAIEGGGVCLVSG